MVISIKGKKSVTHDMRTMLDFVSNEEFKNNKDDIQRLIANMEEDSAILTN